MSFWSRYRNRKRRILCAAKALLFITVCSVESCVGTRTKLGFLYRFRSFPPNCSSSVKWSLEAREKPL